MYLHTLPRSRRSKNRRRNGRWIRCAILDRQWVAPNAKIGLYLLDDNRREVDCARDDRGEPLVLRPQTPINELGRVVDRIGKGLYRLVARNPAGHILARRDFAASWSTTHDTDRKYDPRTEVEALRGELHRQQQALEAMTAERDTAQAESGALKRAVAERDVQIAGLEDALDQQGEALRRADPKGDDDARRARSRRRRVAALRRRVAASAASAEDTAERQPRVFGLDQEVLEGLIGLVAKTIRESTRAGPPVEEGDDGAVEGE